MKKLLIIFLMFLSLPCFAGNLLQQGDEVRFMEKVANDPIPTQYGKDYLIREDYYGYMNYKDSYYGEIVNTLEDATKLQLNKIDIKYLELIKSKIDLIVSLKNNDVNSNSRRKAASKKIVVDDVEYKLLSKEVKNLILIGNICCFE